MCAFNVHVAAAAGKIHSKKFESVPGKTVFSRSVQINMLLKLLIWSALQNWPHAKEGVFVLRTTPVRTTDHWSTADPSAFLKFQFKRNRNNLNNSASCCGWCVLQIVHRSGANDVHPFTELAERERTSDIQAEGQIQLQAHIKRTSGWCSWRARARERGREIPPAISLVIKWKWDVSLSALSFSWSAHAAQANEMETQSNRTNEVLTWSAGYACHTCPHALAIKVTHNQCLNNVEITSWSKGGHFLGTNL